MKLNIQIPDEVYECYERMAERTNGGVSPPEVLAAQLDRFKGVFATDRCVVIESKDRQRLEAMLNTQLVTSEDVVKKVQLLSDVQVGEVRIDFSPAQLRQIKNFATRHRRSTQDIIKTLAGDIKFELLNRVG